MNTNMSWIKAVLTIVASLVFSLLLVEALLRFTGAIPPLKYQKQIFQEHKDLGWLFKPGSHALYDPYQRVVSVNIAQNGFRQGIKDAPKNTSLENKRVLIIGDSVTAGLQVSSGETFSDILTSNENGLYAYNYGVNGYSTDQALMVLEENIDRIQPDLVVYAFVLNDPDGNAIDRIKIDDKIYGKPSFDDKLNFKPKPFSVISSSSSTTLKIKDFLRLHSRIFNLISIVKNNVLNLDKKNESLARRMCAAYSLDRFSTSKIHSDKWDMTTKLISQMKEVSEDSGSKFALFNTPHPVFADNNVRKTVLNCFTTNDQSINSVSEWLESIAKIGDIDIIDFSTIEADKFGEKNDCKLVFALDDGRILDGHLTECGHRFAAQVIEDELKHLYGW